MVNGDVITSSKVLQSALIYIYIHYIVIFRLENEIMKGETILCISAFFTFWGDRMWQFAIGIFLVKLTPGSLQLVATYGLVLSVIAIIFSPMVGDWIDRNRRKYVIRILLLIQNLLVVVCAVIIYLCMYYSHRGDLQLLFQALIIFVGSMANLASQGEKIAIGKDWIVVVCKGNNDLLATTNALLRRIDLTVAILAPLAVGFLMTLVSSLAGIIFICAWNILSLFVEYGLLLKVYHATPDLSTKEKTEELAMENVTTHDLSTKENTEEIAMENEPNVVTEADVNDVKVKRIASWNIVQRFKTVLLGWQIYYRQSVFLAGCSLAMLYLTVIGFSTVTTGFAYGEGLSEAYVSICFGLGSLFGVLGTILFPRIRGKIGLVKTGVVGFSVQILMLIVCGVSIWMPGSPSNLYNGIKYKPSPGGNETFFGNVTSSGENRASVDAKPERILTSIIVLMTGIILSRTGLWLSDLTITQLQQEYIAEKERGIVGGVQYSSNCLFDVGQFVLTIILPKPEQFGILILISICAIILGGVTYLVFVSRFSPSQSRQNTKLISDK